MHWIALLPQHEPDRPGDPLALGWRALEFTPRVALVDEAVLLEVSSTERLWGGRDRLLARIFEQNRPQAIAARGQGATSLIAIAGLRLALAQSEKPREQTALPDDLPLATLSAARPHLPTLARLGCRSWGQLRALPRAGIARRFGAALVDALDRAYGERPESHRWLALPERFDQALDLPTLATGTPGLLWAVQRLLDRLSAWAGARQQGVLALEFEWTLDQRRLNGRPLPLHEQLVLRTAQPTQSSAHLRRLAGEHLARAKLAAPANRLRLRTLETAPWPGASASLLQGDERPGERLHQLVERLGARFGQERVLMWAPRTDHRPERMQQWCAAQPLLARAPRAAASCDAVAKSPSATGPAATGPAATDPAAAGLPAVDARLYPAWLLPAPQPLTV
ncbi:MAG: DNA polymerase Y family protein, partial [Proteobacteria bacterium]|nr:DNA polymerase Y family protein [Pseudomonadota bacterium]